MVRNLFIKKGPAEHEPFRPTPFEEISGSAGPSKSRDDTEGEGGEKVGKPEDYTEGYKQGLAEGAREMEEQKERLETMIEELSGYRERKFHDLFPSIVELAIEIARKVLGEELKSDREAVIQVAKEAMGKLNDGEENVTIRVNPEDYEIFISNIPRIKAGKELKNLEVEPSASISPGGCYIETSRGEIDGRIEEQLDVISDVLRKTNDK